MQLKGYDYKVTSSGFVCIFARAKRRIPINLCLPPPGARPIDEITPAIQKSTRQPLQNLLDGLAPQTAFPN